MTADQQSRAGLLYGLGAYLMWGFLPIYFKALAAVGPTEIVAHRIVWSLFFLAALVGIWKRWPAVRAALGSRVLLTLVITAALIGINWLVWIWAVTNGHVLEGSLGYYLNPLVNVLLGVVLLGERLTPARTFAVLLAAAGVAVLAFGAGDGLWISLTLAASFALYGYVRKVAPVEAVEGLAIETAVLLPVAGLYVAVLGATGAGTFGSEGPRHAVLLALSGLVTAVPLLAFGAAASRIPLTTLGLLQYLAPTIQFLLGITLFGEPLPLLKLVGFVLVWAGLALFTADLVRHHRRTSRPAVPAPA